VSIYAISDIHGQFPDPTTLPADCTSLLIGGDVCPDFMSADQFRWLDVAFRSWLDKLHNQGVDRIVGIAGNHDHTFMNRAGIDSLYLPWTYLQDETTYLEGHNVFGTPWVPTLRAWAFYAEDHKLRDVFDGIGTSTDIIISHSPPLGYGDMTDVYHGSTHAGTKFLNDAIKRVEPKFVICGHIHEARGAYMHDDTAIFNVSAVDENYDLRDNPWVQLV
jgi:Icc-related predicted phosphoesterase